MTNQELSQVCHFNINQNPQFYFLLFNLLYCMLAYGWLLDSQLVWVSTQLPNRQCFFDNTASVLQKVFLGGFS